MRRTGRFLARLWERMSAENIALMAAGVAFYCFLSLAPLLAAVILTYGLIADPSTISEHIQYHHHGRSLADAAKLILDQIVAVVTTSSTKTGFGLLLALFFAIYGATRASVVDHVGDERDLRPARGSQHRPDDADLVRDHHWRGRGGGGRAAVGGRARLDRDDRSVPGSGRCRFSSRSEPGRSPVLLASAAIGAAYRFGPSHAPSGWQWLSVGSGLATLLWLIATIVLGFYVSRFGNYNATYGSLSAIVVLLMWFYVSAYAILLGATINAVITPPRRWRQREGTGQDPTPEGPVEPA